MSEISIRYLARGDGIQAANLIKQLTKNIVDPQNLPQRIEKLTDHVNVQDTGYRYIVVVDSQLMVGFGGLVWYPIPSKGMVGFVEEVVVDEHYRGKGVAKSIMEDLLSLASNIPLQQVKLTTADPAASHIYEKFGFTLKDEKLLIKKYYKINQLRG